MGNLEFKEAFKKIAGPNFNAKDLEAKFGHLILKKKKGEHDRARFEEMCFGHARADSDYAKWFKTDCAVGEAELREQDEGAADERFREELLKEISIGYTTSENKLNQLKESGK